MNLIWFALSAIVEKTLPGGKKRQFNFLYILMQGWDDMSNLCRRVIPNNQRGR